MLCGITYCVPVLFTSSQTTLSPAAELQSRADRPGTVSTRRCFFCLTTVLTFTYKSAFLRHKAAPNTTVPMSLSSRCYGEDYQEHNHCAVRKKTPLSDSTSWVYLTDFTNDENWKVALLQWSCQLSPSRSDQLSEGVKVNSRFIPVSFECEQLPGEKMRSDYPQTETNASVSISWSVVMATEYSHLTTHLETAGYELLSQIAQLW